MQVQIGSLMKLFVDWQGCIESLATYPSELQLLLFDNDMGVFFQSALYIINFFNYTGELKYKIK